jgi:hypothetical protein
MRYTGPLKLILLVAFLSPSLLPAQTNIADELSVSYIYAAVMGTGSYKIDDRRISMLRLPFAYTQREMTKEEPGIKWQMPVVLGYDSLNYEDWVSRLIDDELVTLTILPGFEVSQPFNDIWSFKPFGNLGAGYDFARNETILMGVLGIRGLGLWRYEDQSEFRVGASARLAMEYQVRSELDYGFVMYEGGVDYRRDSNIRLFNHKTNLGVYYFFKLFMPEWDVGRTSSSIHADLNLIHEVGVSAGLFKPRKILGISISRVRLGFKFGENLRGITLGTEFPF